MRDPKPYLTIEQQIERLSSRGMLVADEQNAERWLSMVGYYRLSGYWYPFYSSNDAGQRVDEFMPGTTFDDVAGLYEFDRHLKNHLLSAIERVEVAMRSKIGHTLGARGSLAHLDASNFDMDFVQRGDHMDWLAIAFGRVKRQRGKDVSLKHHFQNYAGQVPVWVLTEVLDFSDLSKLYVGLKAEDRDAIARQLGVPQPGVSDVPRHGRGSSAHRRDRRRRSDGPSGALSKPLEQLAIVRNICAHHSRLWNRKLMPIGTPLLQSLPEFDGVPAQTDTVYGTICSAAFLLDAISPGNTWVTRLRLLIDDRFPYGLRSLGEMGFPPNWSELPLWSTTSISSPLSLGLEDTGEIP
ncbi:Abi family protein [Rhodococcus sp. NBC_00294]|uniref:Abi family protein n=1 Tax=Rhodococcus sp. NBC_00294 TaxID=2976004 RepID=UPI002E2A41A2|nr:Abi family protein [Rhodococcus sp. NBC_00294]